MSLLRAAWAPDEAAKRCYTCKQEFSIVRRKHHCRECGQIFCNSCSSKRKQLLSYHDARVRVCDTCFPLPPPEDQPHARPAVPVTVADEQTQASGHQEVHNEAHSVPLTSSQSCPSRVQTEDPAIRLENLLNACRTNFEDDNLIQALAILKKIDKLVAVHMKDGVDANEIKSILDKNAKMISSMRTSLNEIQELQQQFENSKSWTVVRENSELKVSYAKEDGNPIHSFKIDTVLETELLPLLAIFYEEDLLTNWIPFCSGGQLIGTPSPFQKLIHIKMKFPIFLPVSNRELVMRGHGVDMTHEKRLLVLLRSLRESDGVELPPEDKSHVRMDLTGGFNITYLSEGRVHFSAIYNVDPKLSMVTPMMINFVNKHFCGLLITLIKSTLRKFPGSQYEQRTQGPNARPIYNELRRRLDKFKELLAREQQGDLSVDLGEDSDDEFSEESVNEPGSNEKLVDTPVADSGIDMGVESKQAEKRTTLEQDVHASSHDGHTLAHKHRSSSVAHHKHHTKCQECDGLHRTLRLTQLFLVLLISLALYVYMNPMLVAPECVCA
eukprot:Colp12_sorted_trinity150504_noHs@24810